jgi:hypothetical protein
MPKLPEGVKIIGFEQVAGVPARITPLALQPGEHTEEVLP